MRVFFTLPICSLIILLSFASASAKESQEETRHIGKHNNMKFSSPQQNMKSGAIVGGAVNAAYNAIQNGAKSSVDVAEIVGKIVTSGQNYPTWNTIGDIGNLKVPFTNGIVSQAVFGVKNTKIQYTAATTGQAMNFVNKVAPVVMVASIAYDTWEILDDVKNGKMGEARRKVITKASAYIGGFNGAAAGSVLGTTVFPVVGTAIGAALGGLFGGVFGGLGGDVIVEILRL